MVSKKQEIESNLNTVWKILIYAKEIFLFAFYLHKPDTPEELNFVSHHRHLHFIRYNLWKMTVIELAKLFSTSNNQKFNLIKLLKKLKKGNYYKSLNFNENTLADWELRFEQLAPQIREIEYLRNQYYAHTDNDPFSQEDTALTFEQTSVLIDFASEIVKVLFHEILNIDPIIKPMYYDSRKMDFLKILADEERRELVALSKATGINLENLT
ncbi:MAG: hypothetical protein NVS3B13_33060 [Mucilaginibacter sp.]